LQEIIPMLLCQPEVSRHTYMHIYSIHTQKLTNIRMPHMSQGWQTNKVPITNVDSRKAANKYRANLREMTCEMRKPVLLRHAPARRYGEYLHAICLLCTQTHTYARTRTRTHMIIMMRVWKISGAYSCIYKYINVCIHRKCIELCMLFAYLFEHFANQFTCTFNIHALLICTYSIQCLYMHTVSAYINYISVTGTDYIETGILLPGTKMPRNGIDTESRLQHAGTVVGYECRAPTSGKIPPPAHGQICVSDSSFSVTSRIHFVSH